MTVGVTIVDTGIKVNNPSVVETVKANNGDPINLKAEQVSFAQSAMVDTPTFPKYVGDNQNNEYKSAPITHNGITQAKITVNFYIYKDDVATLKAVADLLRTKGKKKLYCDLAQVRGQDYFEGVVQDLNIEHFEAEGKNVFSCSLTFVELM